MEQASTAVGLSGESPEITAQALTCRLEDMGVVDESIEAAHTVSLRSRRRSNDLAGEASVVDLPRVQAREEGPTWPEIEIKGKLGEGGMGLVQLARQTSVGREVAVKRVRDPDSAPEAMSGLLREGWTTGVLEHPNIVPIYGIGQDEHGEPMILMKKIRGTSWKEVIDAPEATPEAFDADDPIELHIEIASQVCNAVAFAHSQGIIHRDIKPENIMLGAFGEVYLLDWGIAVSTGEERSQRFAHADDITEPEGTLAYMAPEMIDPEPGAIGPWTDVFLLGATLYEVLNGRAPYSGATIYQVMIDAYQCEPPDFADHVPAGLAAICRRAMARDRDQRYPDVEALRQALADFRKHRDALRLSDLGEERMAEVGELMRRERQSRDFDDGALYEAFGKARFAFEQALELKPDDGRARRGLQSGLEWMAERELHNEAPEAASLLVAELPEPRPDLERRLQDLTERLAGEDHRYEGLQKLRFELDLEVGRRGRVRFVAATGALVALSSLLATTLISQGFMERSHLSSIVGAGALTALLGLVWAAGKERLFKNKVNENLVTAAAVLAMSTFFHRVVVWLQGMPLEIGLVLELSLYTVAAVMTSLALGRRYLAAAIPLGAASTGGVIWPDLVFWFYPGAIVAVVAWLVWLWSSPGEGRRSPSSSGGHP